MLGTRSQGLWEVHELYCTPGTVLNENANRDCIYVWERKFSRDGGLLPYVY